MSNHRNHFYFNNADLNPAQTADYTLLLKIYTNSFSYAVTDQSKLLFLKQDVDLAELQEPSDENSLLRSNYRDHIIGLPQNGFTFIPVSLFKPDKVAELARFLDVRPNEKVFSQPLDAQNQVIYKVDERIVNLVAEKFDLNKAVFSAKGWIKSVSAGNPENHQLFVNIDNNLVELLNFRDGSLRFYNSFEFMTPDELVYFTMFITEELKLKPLNTTLILSGDINPNDENFKRLAQFFNIHEFDGHSVLTLTALSLCGSSEAL
jgi:hypothetical protein